MLAAKPTEIPVHPRTLAAAKWALFGQALVSILAATALDGGALARHVAVAVLGYWLGVALLVARRPDRPTPGDVRVVRYGFWLLLAAVLLSAEFRGFVRAHPGPR